MRSCDKTLGKSGKSVFDDDRFPIHKSAHKKGQSRGKSRLPFLVQKSDGNSMLETIT